MTALSFVPTADVEGLFGSLSEEFPEEEASDKLLSYFKSTYIQGPILRRRRRPAMFPIALWNHYQDDLDKAPKTTNCAEGWHSSLRAIFLSSHSSIWNMIRGLKKDMAIQRLIVLNAEVENNDRPKMKYKNLAVGLSEKVAKYIDEQDKLKYLRAVAFIS